jgi:hemolysin D
MASVSSVSNAQAGESGATRGAQAQAFDRAVILRPSPLWAQLVIWAIVSVTGVTILWACLAKIEEAVPATGQLEPQSAVQAVQAPAGGIVQEVLVQEGERVASGEPLVRFDPTTAAADLAAAAAVQERLAAENAFYRNQLQGEIAAGEVPGTLSPEMTRLTSNRANFLAENALYRSILRGDVGGEALSAEQRQRLLVSQGGRTAQAEIDSLEVQQLAEQLSQVREEIANAEQALRVQQDILNRIEPLRAEGISEVQYLQQEQEVRNRETALGSLQEEADRLVLAMSQARVQGQQNTSVSNEALLERIADNEAQIAAIDSQLTKVILDNENQLAQLQGQIEQLTFALENQVLRAPVAGQVFNLQAQSGYVANATEPILEIVPGDALVARVYVTNREIGFVSQRFADGEGEPLLVDVRIDSFPFSEFGDVEGEVIHIGSDALPPNEAYPFFRFPVEIELEAQALGGTLPLQSGMAVTANIKLRKRRVITLLTDLFVRKLDSLKAGG